MSRPSHTLWNKHVNTTVLNSTPAFIKAAQSWIIYRHVMRRRSDMKDYFNVYNQPQSFSNVDGFLLLKNMSSLFPASVRPVVNKHKSEPSSSQTRVKSKPTQLTLWMLQPVPLHVIQVTVLELLLGVVGNQHRDERIHVVKTLLWRKNTNYRTFNVIFWWILYTSSMKTKEEINKTCY